MEVNGLPGTDSPGIFKREICQMKIRFVLFVLGLMAWSLFCAASLVYAAPTLTTPPYPSTSVQPTAASVSVDGTSAISCTVPKAADGSVTPTCDLATVTAGTHSLVVTVSNVYGCTQSADGLSASCVGGGSASSVPFSYTWTPTPAAKPSLVFKP